MQKFHPRLNCDGGSRRGAGDDDKAVRRLVDVERSFVEVMSRGAARFSRPLRHCASVTPRHWALLFQNIEKVRRAGVTRAVFAGGRDGGDMSWSLNFTMCGFIAHFFVRTSCITTAIRSRPPH